MKYTPKKFGAKKIYHLLGIVLLCIVLVVTAVSFTSAWFMDESKTSTGAPNILLIGTVDLEVNTNFNFYNLVLAPDTDYINGTEDGKSVSYATTLKTSSKNDAGAIYVRAKFETNRPELSLIFGSNITTDTIYNPDLHKDKKWYYNALVDEDNDGVYDSGDGYYYYIGSVGTTAITFNTGYHVDNTLNNSVAGEDVTINFIFESIQRPYGAYTVWENTAPEIFKSFANGDSPKANIPE